eukprot:CAMPEP_0194299800 /NCGR_PEP_ID=MMETSP0169-20130528/60911_1 /TAXON_ID=218684 /ORGANISM="Corethron pennatum, Strain L29A3" /LENGTH=1354 /DNA_ID=CAMNT_0039049913 /DNA_START=669 /DNA_END=4730 /DNA_ORIENTATION=+
MSAVVESPSSTCDRDIFSFMKSSRSSLARNRFLEETETTSAELTVISPVCSLATTPQSDVGKAQTNAGEIADSVCDSLTCLPLFHKELEYHHEQDSAANAPKAKRGEEEQCSTVSSSNKIDISYVDAIDASLDEKFDLNPPSKTGLSLRESISQRQSKLLLDTKQGIHNRIVTEVTNFNHEDIGHFEKDLHSHTLAHAALDNPFTNKSIEPPESFKTKETRRLRCSLPPDTVRSEDRAANPETIVTHPPFALKRLGDNGEDLGMHTVDEVGYALSNTQKNKIEKNTPHMLLSMRASSHRINLSARHPSYLDFKRVIKQFSTQKSTLPFAENKECTITRCQGKLCGHAQYQYVETDMGFGYIVDDGKPDRNTVEKAVGFFALPYGEISNKLGGMNKVVRYDKGMDIAQTPEEVEEENVKIVLDEKERILRLNAKHESFTRRVRDHLAKTLSAASLESPALLCLSSSLTARSHSVLILDVTTGSNIDFENEKNFSDIWGCQNRSDAIWLSTVLEFVARRIDDSLERRAKLEWEMEQMFPNQQKKSSEEFPNQEKKSSRCGVDLLSVIIVGQCTLLDESSTLVPRVSAEKVNGGACISDTIIPESEEGSKILLAYEPISWALYERLALIRDAACNKIDQFESSIRPEKKSNIRGKGGKIALKGDDNIQVRSFLSEDSMDIINKSSGKNDVSCWTPQALALPSNNKMNAYSLPKLSPPPTIRPDLVRPLLPSLRVADRILSLHDNHSGSLDAVAIVIASCGKHTDGFIEKPHCRVLRERGLFPGNEMVQNSAVLFEDILEKGLLAGNEMVQNSTVLFEEIIGQGMVLMNGDKEEKKILSSDSKQMKLDEGGDSQKEAAEEVAIKIIVNLAKRYGRRLLVGTVAVCPSTAPVPGCRIGKNGVNYLIQQQTDRVRSKNYSDQFSLLSRLVNVAVTYGCAGQFQHPLPTATDVGNAFATLAISLTELQTETCMNSINATLNENVLSNLLATRPVYSVPREPFQFGHASIPRVIENSSMSFIPQNQRYFISSDVSRQIWDTKSSRFLNVPLQFPNAGGVAFKHAALGENSQVFFHRCFEVEGDGQTVIGDELVVSKDRFVPLTLGSYQANYALMQCIRRTEADSMAQIFNKLLDTILFLDPIAVPKVSFSKCSVYQLHTGYGQAPVSVLVERLFDPKKIIPFTKKMKDTPFDHETIKEIEHQIHSFDPLSAGFFDRGPFKSVSPAEVAECFSHFTYVHSREKFFVGQLQGEYDESSSTLKLTDPTIHSYEIPTRQGEKQMAFKSLDLSKKALHNFFHSHECGFLCRQVMKNYYKSKHKLSKKERNKLTSQQLFQDYKNATVSSVAPVCFEINNSCAAASSLV